MTENKDENRETENYYGETMLIPNAAGGFDEIYETLTQFTLTDRTSLVFRGWDSAQNFRERAKSNSRYERSFNPLVSDLTDYAEAVSEIKLSVLSFLNCDAETWYFAHLSIDIENLQIVAGAKHIEHNQTTTRVITIEEFEAVKQSNPELLELILGFWGFAKSRDSFLKQLKPYTN